MVQLFKPSCGAGDTANRKEVLTKESSGLGVRKNGSIPIHDCDGEVYSRAKPVNGDPHTMTEARIPRDLAKVIRLCDRILDDEKATQTDKLTAAQTIASIRHDQSKVAPLRSALADRTKELSSIRQEHNRVQEELSATKGRFTELEGSVSDLTLERDGLKNDIARLGAELAKARSETASVKAELRNSQSKAEAAQVESQKRLFSLQVLAGHLQADQELALRLFVEHEQALSFELFTAIGVSVESYERWVKTWRDHKDDSTDSLLELLHRAEECVCVQENPNLHRPNDETAVFLRTLLEKRGVAVDRELNALTAKHREDWFSTNRSTALFSEPPLSARHIIPLRQVKQWGEN